MKIGVIGAGQLAQMLSLAAIPMGITLNCIAQSMQECAEPVAELYVISHDDEKALQAFADSVDVITYENENINIGIMEFLSQFKPIYPPIAALSATQDRLYEKHLFKEMGITAPQYVEVNSEQELRNGVTQLGFPCVLKTRRFGYDGKGQCVIRDNSDIDEAWRLLGKSSLILEQFIKFDYEVSMIAARNGRGDFAYYPLTHNLHRNGILRESNVLFDHPELQKQAEHYAKIILDHFNYVGVMAIEFFVKDHHLIANEIAPRVHNSGHWTIEGAVCSQFENHIRAICNYTLGSTATHQPCRMINIIGEQPRISELLKFSLAHPHFYGKQPRHGRKLGHVTLISHDAKEFEKQTVAINALLNEKVNA